MKIRARVTELLLRPTGRPGESSFVVEVAPIDNMGTGRLYLGPFPSVPPYVTAGAVVVLALLPLDEPAEAEVPEPAEPKRSRRKAKAKE